MNIYIYEDELRIIIQVFSNTDTNNYAGNI